MSMSIHGAPRVFAAQKAAPAPQRRTDGETIVKAPVYQPDSTRFTRRDYDRDGFVSQAEWGLTRKREAVFAQLDLDANGLLTQEELLPSRTPPEAPFPVWNFNADQFPGFYDASGEQGHIYNVPQMVANAPRIWETWGPTFEQVGAEFGVDPYAMAAYCMFETYNWEQGNLIPNVEVQEGGLHAAGIAQSQAQLWKGKQVPGLDVYFPASQWETAQVLKANPEYSIRVLAYLMKDAYETTGQDLAQAFPYTAYPMWGDPGISRGAYGNQAQYVSKAYAFYQALRAADGQ